MRIPKPSYLSKLLALTGQLQMSGEVDPDTLRHIEVLHDDWCATLKGLGYCDCRPEVRVASSGKYDG